MAMAWVGSALAQSAPAGPEQRAVEDTLRGMEAAALAADADAYLEHVATGDREFLNEQKYFAKDMAKKPPQAIALTLDEETFKLGDGSAIGKVTWRWNMPEKKEREVSFEAQFVEESGGWRYAGEHWELIETPGSRVCFDPGLEEKARAAASAFAAIRGHVEEEFELTRAALPKKTQKIKLYGSMKRLQASICLAYEDGLSGWNEPGEPIKILVGRRSDEAAFKGLLAHEYGHVATFELGPKSNDAPWWVLEGVAELMTDFLSEGSADRARKRVEKWAAEGKLAPWEQISDFENTPGKYAGHVYTQGHQFLLYLTERFERSGRNRWLTAMAQGESIDEATRKACGKPFEEFAKEWRAALPAETPREEPTEGSPKDSPKKDGKPE